MALLRQTQGETSSLASCSSTPRSESIKGESPSPGSFPSTPTSGTTRAETSSPTSCLSTPQSSHIASEFGLDQQLVMTDRSNKQELLLWGQVLARDHDQLLKMLSLYAAMSPKRVIERHMIFKAKRPLVVIPSTENQPNLQPLVAKLNGPLYAIHLVQDVTEQFEENLQDDPLAHEGTVTSASNGVMETDPSLQLARDFPSSSRSGERNEQEGSIEFRDTPIAGGKGIVTQRATLSTKIWGDDLLEFLDLWGFEYLAENIQEGHMLHHGHVNFWFYRLREIPSHKQEGKALFGGASFQDLPSWDQCSLFDSTGNYILRASVNLNDNTPDLVNQGTEELVTFQRDFKSVVRMKPAPDRLALDTRVK